MSLIAQPIAKIEYLIPQVYQTGNLRTLPITYPSWLTLTISQPLFIPIDENRYNFPVDTRTWFKNIGWYKINKPIDIWTKIQKSTDIWIKTIKPKISSG